MRLEAEEAVFCLAHSNFAQQLSFWIIANLVQTQIWPKSLNSTNRLNLVHFYIEFMMQVQPMPNVDDMLLNVERFRLNMKKKLFFSWEFVNLVESDL